MKSKNIDSIEYSLKRLQRITREIKAISTLVMVIFFLDLFSVLYLALYRRFMNISNYQLYLYIESMMFIATISFIGLVMLHIFDLKKKQGMAIYDLLMEEVQWRFKEDSNLDTSVYIGNIKLILKQFIVNSDLPFVNGNSGKTIYFVLFVLILMVKVYIFLM